MRRMRGPGKHHVEKVKITCLQCGGVFERFPSTAKGAGFCSRSCRAKYTMAHTEQGGELNPRWKGGRTTFTCAQCGEEFEDYPRNDGRKDRQFCSRKCSAKNKENKVTIICQVCGKTAQRIVSQDGPYCSQSCASSVNTPFRRLAGENHWNWKGGVTAKNHADRTGIDFLRWVKAVKQRDGYKCAVCDSDKPRIHAHHILEFADYPSRRYDPDNGVTLCVLHHQMLHPNMVLADTRKYLLNEHDNSIEGIVVQVC